MEIFAEINTIKRELLVQRYKNEYMALFMEQQNGSDVSLERLAELELIIKTHHSSIRLDYDKFMSTLDDVNELYMAQPWNKIYEFTKIRKILEYCNENFNGELGKMISDDLIKLVRLKKLNKKNEIIYNKELKKITSIPVLKINDLDNTYHIKIKH